jgi:hypothetical protein
LVALEIARTPNVHKKGRLEALVRELTPQQLAPSRQVEELARAYLEAKAAPTKSLADMAHVAYATAHGLDVIVSWNLEHIVRVRTRLAVNGINKLLGYRELEIATPEEMIGYGT